MYRHYKLRVRWVWTRISLIPTRHGNTGISEYYNGRI